MLKYFPSALVPGPSSAISSVAKFVLKSRFWAGHFIRHPLFFVGTTKSVFNPKENKNRKPSDHKFTADSIIERIVIPLYRFWTKQISQSIKINESNLLILILCLYHKLYFSVSQPVCRHTQVCYGLFLGVPQNIKIS